MMRGVGPFGQHVAHVGRRDVIRVERKDAILDRAVDHAAGGSRRWMASGAAQRTHAARGDDERLRGTASRRVASSAIRFIGVAKDSEGAH